MLDEPLPHSLKPPAQRSLMLDSKSLPSTALLDQSKLMDLADRLVTAARRAGADAADALAVRAVSLGVELRDGAVEESERAEGDDLGLRVLVGQRQALVCTNDSNADVAELFDLVPPYTEVEIKG